MIADILGKNRLRRLGFNIPVGCITTRQAVMLNKAAEELPSESDITKADDIELQAIAEKTLGIISQIKDIQIDTEDLFEEFREYPRVHDDSMKEDITKQNDALNNELATRQESIDLLKGRLKNQITSFKETIAKVKTPHWVKRSELCLESKESRSLPYSRLSVWPSGYLLKHYYQAVGVQFQVVVASLHLRMKKV